MAETSGFFDAVYSESTESYDLEYIAAQFAAYFALFVGNGVFGSPTNQLKVSSGDGMTVKVSPGWAFINGYWYHNDEELIISVASNLSSASRLDSVLCRWDAGSRRISVVVQTGKTSVTKDGSYYDLKLADISVPAGATYVPQSNITDTRTDEAVCGFVTHILEVQTTADLFAQYEAIFNDWFNGIKGQVSGDLGTQLLSSVSELETTVEGIKTGDVFVAKANSAETANSATTAGTASKANSAETANSATTANKLKTPRTINGVEFDGTKNIKIVDDSKPVVIYATTEPTTVPENTIVFVYEE